MVGKMKKSISNSKTSARKQSLKTKKQSPATKRHGPRLPNALIREFGSKNTNFDDDDMSADSDGEINNDLYEYDEIFAEEETTKNKRFDPIDNYQYELPDDFKDENIESDDDDDDAEDDEDDGRHVRMLKTITGSDAFDGRNKRGFELNGSGEPTESEYDMSGDVDDGPVTMYDFLEPLQGKYGSSVIKKNIRRIAKKANPLVAPLHKAEQARIERQAANNYVKKDIRKWEPIIKRNRETTTLHFDEDVDLGYSTIGAIASGFVPRSDFEIKMASHLSNSDVVEAHNKDGARILELNKLSVEEMKNYKDRMAKTRSLLFRHEMKAKRIKKIKSKMYHRLLQKDRRKAAATAYELDPEAAKEDERKREIARVEERMTLKHNNSKKWARRILKRGLDVADPNTREALGEQLNKHAALTRKINSVNESSSSDESSDDDSDDVSADSDDDSKLKRLLRAKEKTLKELEEDDEELPNSGVHSLPFMVRSSKKRREAAEQEANAAVEEYDRSLKQLEGDNVKDYKGSSSGRMAFGAPKTEVKETSKKIAKSDNYFGNSDSESDDERKENEALEINVNNKSHRVTDIDPSVLHEISGVNHDSVLKTVEDVDEPEPNINIEVAYLASDTWKKMKKSSGAVKKNENRNIHDSQVTKPQKRDQDLEGDDEDDSDSGGEMVDGILSAGAKSSYEIPSHEEVIRRAFAGDDVEDAFEKDKEAVLGEENPEPEKPKLVLGWGQWTNVQKKKGLPSWMLAEHETAKNKREESLQKRKDSKLKNVIISEKFDQKKAEKLHTQTLPFPYKSKETYDQSMRMPLGPEFNPASAVGALTRPPVVKKSGLIIKPIQYEDVKTHDGAETNRQNGGQKRKSSKDKNQSMKKKKTAKV